MGRHAKIAAFASIDSAACLWIACAAIGMMACGDSRDPISVKTSGWHEFRASDIGLSFRHPGGWEVSQSITRDAQGLPSRNTTWHVDVAGGDWTSVSFVIDPTVDRTSPQEEYDYEARIASEHIKDAERQGEDSSLHGISRPEATSIAGARTTRFIRKFKTINLDRTIDQAFIDFYIFEYREATWEITVMTYKSGTSASDAAIARAIVHSITLGE